MPAVTPRELAQVIAELRGAGCVFAEDEAGLLVSAAGTAAELGAMLRRRTAGTPLEQVLGWAEFCGLRIVVEPGVFVPRRRTEFLARQAAALARQVSGVPVVLDLCCGSGAVAAALASMLGDLDDLELYAAELDPAAVRCARRNLAGVPVLQGDLYQALPARLRGRLDVLVVNAPYVPSEAIAQLPPEARLHEPGLALDGGPDGLDVQRRVIEQAGHWLAPAGQLLIETSRQQSAELAATMTGAGLRGRVSSDAELGATVVIGQAGPAGDER
ncbi:MAG: putative protein N(5)-glutamine methyltransferase [Jatrophihabitans sp.]